MKLSSVGKDSKVWKKTTTSVERSCNVSSVFIAVASVFCDHIWSAVDEFPPDMLWLISLSS